MKSSFKRFENLLRSLFPEADISEPHKTDYFCMDFSWKSNDDPQRKNKRTKTFRVIISQERIEDYEALPSPEKEVYEHKVSEFIQNGRAQMQPNHNNPYGSAAPIEEWHIEV